MNLTYRPKCCGNNNKVEDNSPKNLNDKNHQASSKKFRQLSLSFVIFSINYFKVGEMMDRVSSNKNKEKIGLKTKIKKR